MVNSSKGKRKTQFPCKVCSLHKTRCICEFIPKLNLKTKVSLIIHAKELKRTTNTGRLAITALINSEMHIRGLDHQALDLSNLLEEKYHSVLFFPSEDAFELDDQYISNCKLPIQLIIPDGNWRQASKVNTRHKELSHIPRVKISTPNTMPLHIRPETTEYGMATLEAIAHALGLIEGESVKSQLMHLFQLKLIATVKGRGKTIL